MPKDNEVDEKVMPVAWIVTNGGESCEPWLEYEQSEVDALPAVCIAEPLYSAATVAELRGEVERLQRELTLANGWNGDPQVSARTAVENANALTDIQRQRADAAERRVGELEALVGTGIEGEVLEMGDDEDGNPRVTLYTSREQIKREARNLIFKKARLIPILTGAPA